MKKDTESSSKTWKKEKSSRKKKWSNGSVETAVTFTKEKNRPKIVLPADTPKAIMNCYAKITRQKEMKND